MISKVYAASVTVNDSDLTISQFIARVIDFVLPLIAGVLMAMVIYGGFLYITSGGDPEKTGKAKKTILWAVVAVILITISYSIVVGINRLVNTEFLP